MISAKEVTVRLGSEVIGKVISKISGKGCTNTFTLQDEDTMNSHLHTHMYMFDFKKVESYLIFSSEKEHFLLGTVVIFTDYSDESNIKVKVELYECKLTQINC